jgi:hypothetical protein
VSAEGVKRADALKYDSFSEYVEHLIRKDVEERPPHIVVREEGEGWPKTKPASGSDARR